VQDHAILTISCLTLVAHARGSTGFAARQFAIGDVADVDFRQFSGGTGVAAYETSKINVSSPGVYGNASRFASAMDLSQITIGGTIRIADGLTFDVAFLSALFGSIVSVFPTAIEGGKAVSGASYQCASAIVKAGAPLPGGNVAYSDNQDCKFFGIASDIALDRGVRDGSEARAIRTELIDALKRSEKKQRQSDRLLYGIITGLAVLTLATMGTIFYRRSYSPQ